MSATSGLTVLHDAHFNVPLMVSDFCEAKIVSNHRAAPMQQQGSRGECDLARYKGDMRHSLINTGGPAAVAKAMACAA